MSGHVITGNLIDIKDELFFLGDIPGTLVFGVDGATFVPVLAKDGTLSWKNDRNLSNPAPVNIRGPQGETGETGAQGVGITGITIAEV